MTRSILAAAAALTILALPALGATLPPVNEEPTKTECSACHMAYPAGLMPARSWKAIMSDSVEPFRRGCQPRPGGRQEDRDLPRRQCRRHPGLRRDHARADGAGHADPDHRDAMVELGPRRGQRALFHLAAGEVEGQLHRLPRLRRAGLFLGRLSGIRSPTGAGRPPSPFAATDPPKGTLGPAAQDLVLPQAGHRPPARMRSRMRARLHARVHARMHARRHGHARMHGHARTRAAGTAGTGGTARTAGATATAGTGTATAGTDSHGGDCGQDHRIQVPRRGPPSGARSSRDRRAATARRARAGR